MKKTFPPFSYSPSIVDFDTGEICQIPTLGVKIFPQEGFLPFHTQMLIDSGAEDTLLHETVGIALGIDVRSGKPRKIGGVGGKTTGYEHEVKIELKQLGDTLELTAVFVPDLGFTGVLGQIDFFLKYDVCFSRRNLQFTITRMPTIKF